MFTLKGEGNPNQGQAYSADVSYCEKNSIAELLSNQLSLFNYAAEDSIGIFLADMIYR